MSKGNNRKAKKGGQTNTPKTLSLLAPDAMGGLIARQGFNLQDRYVAQRLPHLLKDPYFYALQPEGIDDTDVHRLVEGVRRVRTIQVKGGGLGPSDLGTILKTGIERLGPLITGKQYEGFELAARHPSDGVRSVFDALARLRGSSMEEQLQAVRDATNQHWLDILSKHELASYEGFIREYLFPRTDIIDVDQDEELFQNIAAHLTVLPVSGGRMTPHLVEVARELVSTVSKTKTLWRREAIEGLLASLVARHERPGPHRVLLLIHETLKRVSRAPGAINLPVGLRDLQRTTVEVSSELGGSIKKEDIERTVAQVAERIGPLRKALQEHPDAAVVYLGFPHVPLAVLVGYIVGTQYEVHLLEHDRRTDRFEWLAPVDPPGARVEAQTMKGTQARLRVSVSAEVDEAHCLVPGPVGCDVHVRVGTPGLGLIQSEEAARVIAGEVQRALEQHITGKGYEQLHVFAAVPVSVAFLLGRVLSFGTMPSAVVYNFVIRPRPRYNWSLDLYAAEVGEPAVAILNSRSIE
ncbi:SAVED domain-containing protein [Archangium gephyra]|uniref:SAVED domain-containing protein n=1 Tax=Archangium gephyra TaxID=48 RepID=UPI0035D4F4A4